MILKLLFVSILFIHGLIHLLGFVKEWQLAQVSQLTGATLFPLSGNLSKVAGLLWLLAFILFVVSSSAYLLGQDIWWMVAFWALLISQILIIIYWPDAKFGTIANIIIFIVVYLSFATAHFNKDVKIEMNSFLSKTDAHAEKIVTKEMLENLPICIQKWLVNSKVLDNKNIYTIYLKQKGELRTKMDGKWMPVEAEQVTRVEEPGFIWSATIQAAPFIHIRGRDKYENGKGNMLVKLLSFITVADSKGKETD
ncbi:MAG: hypothetical protein GWP06_13165, partial [Actinobacteria bacterium]|nr:hypothetical protein [Actinomycetota bacterium]